MFVIYDENEEQRLAFVRNNIANIIKNYNVIYSWPIDKWVLIEVKSNNKSRIKLMSELWAKIKRFRIKALYKARFYKVFKC